uniref:Guanylate kinase-like domain-containing protein n=1 Tax=Callorhinchus milii TaxID=7868 RepID=A0A4W3IEQ7_CALMI|eukprot:gi/632947404/ref/XP_007889028.1/ PREDICTED: leucine-rich repeat and guanylate kinase domain-containing protein [Callorhinchus milii]
MGDLIPISPVYTPLPSRPVMDEKTVVEILREILAEVVRGTAQESVEDMTMLMAEDILNLLVDEYSKEVEKQFMEELKDLNLSSSESSSSDFEVFQDQVVQQIFDGRLTKELINEGLSNLSHSASGQEQVYLNLSLPDLELIDVSILSEYNFIQNIDISNNKITDMSWVNHMPHLLQLNASENELTSFFQFKPPKHLKEVDFSYNNISEMEDLSAYQFLSKLILDNNQISEIKGLENCNGLIYLSLAHNDIYEITGLENLPITFLSLRDNHLTDIRELMKLESLQQIDLSKNEIKCMGGLEDHDLLQVINLEDNQISELNELHHIEKLPYLEFLNLLNNPIQDNPDYWLTALFKAPKLTELDHKKVKITDKVAAVNKYNPPPEVVAARDHMTHVMNYFLQPQRISDSTLLSLDMPYPVLVLTGPQASGKRELAHMLCQEFSNFFGYCACHTTRKPYLGEKEGCDYYFVSKEIFEVMIDEGKFIETIKYNGHYYGLSRDALEAVAREGLGCCIQMELEGVRSLKKTYLEPRYILLIPLDKEEYKRRLWLRGMTHKSEIDVAISRVDTYIKMNQDHPGYFDSVINTNDLMDAYAHLNQLLREYLNLTDQTSSDSDRITAGDKRQTSGSLKVTPDEKEVSTDNQLNQSKTGSSSVDFSDSATRNYSSRVQARLSSEKTSMEQDSIERREQMAREAVQGRIPLASICLFHRIPVISSYVGAPDEQLSDVLFFTSMMPNASNSTQSQISKAPEDRSNIEESKTTSSVTTFSSAEIFSEHGDSLSVNGSLNLDVLNLLESKRTSEPATYGFGDDMTDNASDQDLQDSEQREARLSLSGPVAAPTFRIGDNIKPVLPPIPSGWKREIPEEPAYHQNENLTPS